MEWFEPFRDYLSPLCYPTINHRASPVLSEQRVHITDLAKEINNNVLREGNFEQTSDSAFYTVVCLYAGLNRMRRYAELAKQFES